MTYTREQSIEMISRTIRMFLDAMVDCGISEQKAMEVMDLVDQRLVNINFGKIVGDKTLPQ